MTSIAQEDVLHWICNGSIRVQASIRPLTYTVPTSHILSLRVVLSRLLARANRVTRHLCRSCLRRVLRLWSARILHHYVLLLLDGRDARGQMVTKYSNAWTLSLFLSICNGRDIIDAWVGWSWNPRAVKHLQCYWCLFRRAEYVINNVWPVWHRWRISSHKYIPLDRCRKTCCAISLSSFGRCWFVLFRIWGAIELNFSVSCGNISDCVHTRSRCIELPQAKCCIVLYSFSLRIVVTVIFCHAIQTDENTYFIYL